MINKKLILASKSPRRKFLLEQGDFVFRVVTQDTDESYDDTMDITTVPEYLSTLKAKAVHDHLTDNEIIVAADTVVISPNKEILGKPKNSQYAIEILSQLSDGTHDVITGVSLLSNTKSISFSVTSTVDFDALDPSEIDYYVDNYKPFDKAGAYGIQDWIGWCKIKSIRGSYSNIMGLPMNALYKKLLTF